MTPPATPPIQAPYPGLRPFLAHEWPIFCGRRENVPDMLTLLENHRFLAVVGPSGSGKSSLVMAGLIPALQRGELLTARSDSWRTVILRPGDAPYRNLAVAAQRRLSEEGRPFHDADVGLTELVLRNSPFAFGEVLRDAGTPKKVNVLLVVDQFEEIFRFRSLHAASDSAASQSRDDAAFFVQLLLETAKQTDWSVYVMLTMRTDFLGECDIFDGLPQAINESQYLTPRLSLAQLTEAIYQPPRQPPFNASVEQEVGQRILNDVGTDRDELPIVQHALLRAWQCAKQRLPHEPVRLTLKDYLEAGGLKNSIAKHADEVLKPLESSGKLPLVERVFRGLCARGPNGQQIRRPATIQQLADESGASQAAVKEVVEAFRREECNFLTPPPQEGELAPGRKIDISHESLLRQWKTLRNWAEQEARSAATFIRLRDAALKWPAEEPLLRDPILSAALAWSEQEKPSSAWAKRYGGGLDRALEYLRESEREKKRAEDEAQAARQRELEQAKALAAEKEAVAKQARQAQKKSVILNIVLGLFALAAMLTLWQMAAQNRVVKSLHESVAGLQSQSNALVLQLELFHNTNLMLRQEAEAKETAISNAAAQVRSLTESKARLAGEQEQLEQLNAALSAIAAANGSVIRSSSDSNSISVTFRESAHSLDEIIPLLPIVGNVHSLDLSHSTISDAGLTNVAQLPGLTSLDLSFTEITDHGVANLLGLKRLTNFILNDTLITQASLPPLATLTNLQSLDLSRDQVNAAAVTALRAKLSGCVVVYEPDALLDVLSTCGGDFLKAITFIGGELELRDLSLGKSAIGDAGLRALSRWGAFDSLKLGYCNEITDDGLKYVARIHGLRSLRLENCNQLSNRGMKNLGLASDLKALLLDGIAVTDRALPMIGQLTNLESLYLNPYNIVDVYTPEDLVYLKPLHHLRYLALDYMHLGAGALRYVSQFEMLHTFQFMGSEVPGPEYELLKNLPQLEELDMTYSSLDDEALKHIYGLTQLKEIHLYKTKVTVEGAAKLKEALPGLKISWQVMPDGIFATGISSGTQ